MKIVKSGQSVTDYILTYILYHLKKFYQKPVTNNKTTHISFSEMEARNKLAAVITV